MTFCGIPCVHGACLLGRCHDTNAHVRRDAIVAIVTILRSPAVNVSSNFDNRMSALFDGVKERLCDIQVILTA